VYFQNYLVGVSLTHLNPISKGIFQNMRIAEVFGLAALFAAVAGEICKK
jgi:hypothetical protein